MQNAKVRGFVFALSAKSMAATSIRVIITGFDWPMIMARSTIALTRRALLRAASWGGLGLVGAALTPGPGFGVSDALQTEENELIKRLTGKEATEFFPHSS